MTTQSSELKSNMLFRKLAGDLRLNRGSFFAVWLVFVIGLTFYSGTYPAGSNMLNQINTFYQDMHLADLTFEFPAVDATIVETVQNIPGVERISGRLSYDMGLPGTASLTTIRLLSITDDVNGIRLTEGRLPATPDEIVLTAAFAAAQRFKIGDQLTLTASSSQSFTVSLVGLVTSSEYLIGSRGLLQPFPTLSTFGPGYMSYDALAMRMNAAGKINSLALTIAPDADLNAVHTAIINILKPDVTLGRSQNASYVTLKANGESNTQVGLIFSLIFLFGSGAIMAVLLARQVDSEKRYIGTLRALGFSRLEITIYYLAFALIICITGSVIAVPLGYLITWPLMTFFENGLIGTVVPFFYNPPNVPFILFGVIAELILGLMSAALPAWRAATTDPGIALRPPFPSSTVRQINVPGLPLAGKQAVRNMLRVPGRTVSTILGTACGLSIIVMAFAVWDTIDYNFIQFFNERTYDLVVTVNDLRQQDALRRQIEAVEGVTGIETGLIAPVKVETINGTYSAPGIVLDDNEQYIGFNTLAGVPALTNNHGVWLGHNLARVLRANVGDTLSVTAQGVNQQVRVEGIVGQVLGAPMYVPMSLFSQWTPLGMKFANQAYLRIDSSHKAEIQRQLALLPGVIGVEDWHSTIQDIRRAMDFNGNFAFVFLGFGLLLTFVVLFNTINANLHERRNELIIMRMQGFSMAEIRRLVTWETMLASVVGLLIGVPPTALLADYVMQLYNTDVAGNITAVYPTTWIIAICLLAGTVLLSQIIPLQSIRQANMGDVSKSVSV